MQIHDGVPARAYLAIHFLNPLPKFLVHQGKNPKISPFLSFPLLSILITTVILGLSVPVLAQSSEEDLLPRLTLEDLVQDPFLPTLPIDRPLSPLERKQLRQDLDQLHLQASQIFADGDNALAFEQWFREIRLRRYLGILDEVLTLAKVGEAAWNEGLRLEVLLITQRLLAIQNEFEVSRSSLRLPVLEAVGVAYQNVRALSPAIDLYTKLANQARQADSQDDLERYLVALAQTYSGALKHAQAAETTRELLELIRLRPIRPQSLQQQQRLLEDLAFLHGQAGEWQAGIEAQQELIQLYQTLTLESRVPSVQVAIARNQLQAGQEDGAIETYREAYALAQGMQQFDVAQDILLSLIDIYYQRNEPRTVLNIYKVLVRVNQQTADDYGLMEAYNRLGQFYLDYDGYDQALEVFQRALNLAHLLDHRVAEFEMKIDEVKNAQDL